MALGINTTQATPPDSNTGDFDVAWTAQSIAGNKDGYSTNPLNTAQPNQGKQVYNSRALPAGGLNPGGTTIPGTGQYVHT